MNPMNNLNNLNLNGAELAQSAAELAQRQNAAELRKMDRMNVARMQALYQLPPVDLFPRPRFPSAPLHSPGTAQRWRRKWRRRTGRQ